MTPEPAGAPAAERRARARDALRELAIADCEAVTAANNLPIAIEDPGVAWFVECGALDVFAVEYRDGAASSFTHLLHATADRLVFGVGADAGADVSLLAKGLPGTRLRRVPLPALSARPADASPGGGNADAHGAEPAPAAVDGPLASEVVRQVDAWIEAVAAAVARDLEVRPPADARLVPGTRLQAAGTLTADRGVVWLAGRNPDAAFLGAESCAPGGPDLMPVTTDTWVEAPAAPSVAVRSSRELAREMGVDRLLDTALAEFHRMAVSILALNRRLMLVDSANRQRASGDWRHLDERRARRGLYAGVHDPTVDDDGETPLVAALEVIARHERVKVQAPARTGPDDDPPGLQEILDHSGLRRRRVRLGSGDGWWLGDSGAMLAFRRRDGHPVALLPGRAGRYRAFDPAAGTTRSVTKDAAGEFAEDAWLLYRPVTGDSPGAPVGLRGLFRVARPGLAADLLRLAVAGLFAGLLVLTPAIAIGVMVERVIPAGATGRLLEFTLVLSSVALITALAQLLRGTAQMRIEGRTAAYVTAALMDRVLRLGFGTLKRYTAGELGMRVAAFHHLRDSLGGAAAAAVLSAVFLLPATVVIFFYSTTLGWLTLALGLAFLIVVAGVAAAQLGPKRRCFEASRRSAGNLLQFMTGIGKLRSARAEGSAFAVWARLFREQKRAESAAASLSEQIAAFSEALPVLAGAIVVAMMLSGGSARSSLPDFLVVYALSTMFFTTLTGLGRAFEALADVVPSCDAVRPILEAGIEQAPSGRRDLRMTGDLAFDRVCFRYHKDGPHVLQDVTIHAGAGEMIAIVGESGAGKSTLVRLALGLEEPVSGAVYYDGCNLAQLDAGAVRRQIGVVTQDADLQPGSILSNIVGAEPDFTIDDAWRTARLAALDEDIAAMPLGMHTPVAEAGATLSGGQRQRLVIAAALLRRPRMVILDEATSWLDSATQDEVMARIAATAVTRIVIAHRLSTTRRANRIYVLQAGRVVQEGTFDELSSVAGPFRDLIERQT